MNEAVKSADSASIDRDQLIVDLLRKVVEQQKLHEDTIRDLFDHIRSLESTIKTVSILSLSLRPHLIRS